MNRSPEPDSRSSDTEKLGLQSNREALKTTNSSVKHDRIEASEAEQLRQKRELVTFNRVFVAGWVILLICTHFVCPIFTPVMIGVFGLWLVIGSGDFWRRIIATAALTFILGVGSPELMALLLSVLFLTASGSYLIALFASRQSQPPIRVLQFSLWEFGGCILAFAAGMAMLRGTGFDVNQFEDVRKVTFLVATALVASVNVLIVASPILIPSSCRGYRWLSIVAFITLVIMPNLEYLICEKIHLGLILRFDNAYSFSIRFPNAYFSFEHFIALLGAIPSSTDTGPLIVAFQIGGTLLAWLMVYTLEGALAFYSVDRVKLTPPEQGQLD